MGKSTLKRWHDTLAEDDLLCGRPEDMNLELARLRQGNELLRQQRQLLNTATGGSTGRRQHSVCKILQESR